MEENSNRGGGARWCNILRESPLGGRKGVIFERKRALLQRQRFGMVLRGRYCNRQALERYVSCRTMLVPARTQTGCDELSGSQQTTHNYHVVLSAAATGLHQCISTAVVM